MCAGCNPMYQDCNPICVQRVARALNSWMELAAARRRARRHVQRVLARATRREVRP